MILAFDSTAKVASVALMRAGQILAEYSLNCGLTQSELLLPMAEHCLASVRADFSDVSCLACTVGPGSFTGVRIGVATVKGLAFGKNLPCIEVSTLEALAENLHGAARSIMRFFARMKTAWSASPRIARSLLRHFPRI